MGLKESVASDETEALLRRRGDDGGLDLGGVYARSPKIVSVFMADYGNKNKFRDSRTENSWDVLFVAVAVYLWTDKRYVAHVLTKGACYFSYMRTSLNCSFVGAVRLFPDDVSNILALSSG